MYVIFRDYCRWFWILQKEVVKKKFLTGGNSGLEVILHKDTLGRMLVRKQSKNSTQSKRLLQQYKKHLFFSKLKNLFFKVPEIYNKGFKNRLFFYEYKYVEGENFISFLKDKDIKEILPVIDNLFRILEYFSKKNTYFEKEFKTKTFKKALEDKIITNSSSLGLSYQLRKKLLLLLKNIDLVNKKTLHHGDFTFDNIIIGKDKSLSLIDYSGGFYPHYWMDIVRLFQDTEGEWYKIKHKMEINKKKITYINRYIRKKTNEFDKEYLNIHNFLMAITFLRIMPYMKSELDKKKILRKIETFSSLG